MKITSIKTFIVPPRWCFLKIETDEGVVGWGEPVIEGKAATVATAVDELSDYLIGKDPAFIEDHWNVMYRGGFYRGGPILMSAIAGIDQALWDIKGKVMGQPIHALLGGACRTSMKTYSWVGGDRPADVANAVRERIAQGFDSVKLNGAQELQIVDSHKKIDEIVETISTVRDAAPDVNIGVDFHGRVHKPMVKTLVKALEPFNLMFIEEPVLSENFEAIRDIASNTHTPIALGERLYSRWDFKNILASGYVDIIQPDLSHAGGITECRKIASMAEAYDIALAPHCPLGPIALAACLHVDAVSYNAFIQEQSVGIHYNAGADLLDYITNKEVFDVEDGMMKLPQGPGLGVDVDEEFVKKMAETGHNWKNPVWRHKDGSVAEW
ncbi:galactonate dehydratase [Hirschia maritima]|uniref:galactonate dehydratase n=1 Tax=Hirschia maritima TaxID=1121961 RepID=UPI000360F923|nr:galactonate dehydratase [Hirschia maritima]